MCGLMIQSHCRKSHIQYFCKVGVCSCTESVLATLLTYFVMIATLLQKHAHINNLCYVPKTKSMDGALSSGTVEPFVTILE